MPPSIPLLHHRLIQLQGSTTTTIVAAAILDSNIPNAPLLIEKASYISDEKQLIKTHSLATLDLLEVEMVKYMSRFKNCPIEGLKVSVGENLQWNTFYLAQIHMFNDTILFMFKHQPY